MKCTSSWRGHKWTAWIKVDDKLSKREDGRWHKPMVQRRTCSICHYNQSEWLPEWTIIDIPPSVDTPSE
jgi:hypothetical protein